MFALGELNVKGLVQFENMLGAVGKDAPKIMNRALNRTGDMARTQLVRVLANQTSLPQKTIRKAVKTNRSSWTDLEYRLNSSGGDISLKYFKPRETRRGVSAFVQGERRLFEGSFLKGGQFETGRVMLRLGGHVFQRLGSDRLGIEKLKSGVVIPDEMLQDKAIAAFDGTVMRVLPQRVSHELDRALGV